MGIEHAGWDPLSPLAPLQWEESLRLLKAESFLDLNDPHVFARLPNPVKTLIASLSISQIEQDFPGFKDGKYFRQRFEAEPEAFVPDEALRNSILFAGEDDMVSLQRRVDQRIEGLKNNFPTPYRRNTLNIDQIGISSEEQERIWMGKPLPENVGRTKDTIITPAFNAFKIRKVMRFVEQFMQYRKKRLTGEDNFAHILRLVDRGIDLIQVVSRYHRNHPMSLYFTPEVAESFLLTVILHDFSEDEYEVQNEDGSVSYFTGEVVADQSSRSLENNLLLRILEKPDKTTNKKNGKKTPHETTKTDRSKEKIIQEMSIDMDSAHIPYVTMALRMLNSRLVEDRVDTDRDEHIPQMNDRTERQRIQAALYDPSQMILESFGQLVKLIDRIDNLFTRAFEYDGEKHVPRDLKGIISKYKDTLVQFPYIQYVLFDLLSSRHIFDIGRVFPRLEKMYFRYITITNSKELNEFLPVRIAKMMMMGLTLEEIFEAEGKYPFKRGVE